MRFSISIMDTKSRGVTWIEKLKMTLIKEEDCRMKDKVIELSQKFLKSLERADSRGMREVSDPGLSKPKW